MKNIVMFSILLLLLSAQAGLSQVAVNTTGASSDPSAILDVNAQDKGLLIPRVSLNSVADNTVPVNNPAVGLLIYNTGGNMTPGIYIWTGQSWASLATMEQVLNALPPASGSGIYGEMSEYHNAGSFSNIYIPCGGNYIQWSTAVQGDFNGMSYSSSNCVIENSGAYSVSFNSVFQLPSGNKMVDAALYVNGIRQDQLHGRAWFKEARASVSFSGLITLLADDVVSVWFTRDDEGSIRLEIANLSLTKID